MRTRRALTVGASLALGLASALPAQRAEACGGLFCSSASPVNQAAERIIFSFDRPTRTVTAVVEILYEGPSEKFAWVLPVPGIPEIGVSSGTVLDRLQSVTNPTYSIQRSWGDQCGGRSGGPFATAPGAPPPVLAPTPSPGAGPSVSVLASGSVGPYNYDVIQVVPANSDPAEVAITWLKANGYDVGALGPDVLRPYLRDGLNLVAFKLLKNQAVGSIRPVMLTYKSDHPMIPIRPTAVAANEDMGILVWVLSSARAVPTNYRTLEINEAVLDWFNPNTAYNDVISAAADEAGGQGFVTELATPTATASLADNIYVERGQIDQFRSMADGLAAPQLLVQAVESLSTFSVGSVMAGPFGGRSGGRVALDGLADVFAKHLNIPAGVTVADVLAGPRCYFQTFRTPGSFYCEGKPAPATISLAGFDRVAFLTDIEALVIQPLEKTVKLVRDQRYVTRLYTTMSAGDMTLDPEFDLNTQLPDVASAHTVALKYLDSCPGNTTGRWEATLSSGQMVFGKDSTWPHSPKQQTMPVNLRVMQLSATGPGRVVKDNSVRLGAPPVADPPGAAPTPGGPRPPIDSIDGDGSSAGGGCAIAPRSRPAGMTAAGALVLATVLLGLARARRRRG